MAVGPVRAVGGRWKRARDSRRDMTPHPAEQEAAPQRSLSLRCASEERQERRRGVELLAPPLRAAARRVGRVAVLGREDDARCVDHARLLADLVKVAQPKVSEWVKET